MKKFGVLGVLSCLWFTFAMKRTREEDPNVDPNDREPKRPALDPVTLDQQALGQQALVHPALEPMEDGKSPFENFPPELISETCAWLIDDYPLRPDVINPLGYLHCVSKDWEISLTGGEYPAKLIQNPHCALHTLTLLCYNQIPIDNTHLKLIKAAYPLMNADEKYAFLLNAGSIDVLRLLSKTKFEVITIHQFSDAIRRLTADTGIALPCYGDPNADVSLDEKEKSFLADCLDAKIDLDKFFFENPHNVVKLLFIDDLYRPTQFTWGFEVVTKFGSYSYNAVPAFRPRFAGWVKSMSNIILPKVRRNLLLECFAWPMVLAALIKDREFVQLFKEDIDISLANRNIVKSYPHVLRALQGFAHGGDFVVSDVKHLEYICHERGFLENVGFPMDAIREALAPFLPQFVETPKFLLIEAD